MRVSTKIVVDLATGAVIERECHEYLGPVAECISFGGSKSKSKNQSQQTSSSGSGTKYNENFLDQAKLFAAGKRFNSGQYLLDNPDVNEDPYFSQNPYEHYLKYGQDRTPSNGTSYIIDDPTGAGPTYDPKYVRVAPEGFDKLEKTLYEGQQSKLSRAYNEAVAKQREELAQSGALNSPSQYLQGSARSGLDRNYMESLQQAARDAFTGRLGLEEREAGRETGFNEQTAARLLELWLKKLGIAIEGGRYSTSTGQGTSQGSGSGSGFNFGLFNFGGSQNSNSSSNP